MVLSNRFKVPGTPKSVDTVSPLALQVVLRQGEVSSVSSKELALDLVRRLPEEASLLGIAKEIEFVAGIRAAISELDCGEIVTAEELLREISKWAGTTK